MTKYDLTRVKASLQSELNRLIEFATQYGFTIKIRKESGRMQGEIWPVEPEFKNYRKMALQPMRKYVVGEDLTGVSVSKEDVLEEGGMIAVNPSNSKDKWYVSKQFFLDNYEEAK